MVRQLQLFHESETLIPPKLQQVLTKCLCSRSAFHRVYDRKGKSAYFVWMCRLHVGRRGRPRRKRAWGLAKPRCPLPAVSAVHIWPGPMACPLSRCPGVCSHHASLDIGRDRWYTALHCILDEWVWGLDTRDMGPWGQIPSILESSFPQPPGH